MREFLSYAIVSLVVSVLLSAVFVYFLRKQMPRWQVRLRVAIFFSALISFIAWSFPPLRAVSLGRTVIPAFLVWVFIGVLMLLVFSWLRNIGDLLEKERVLQEISAHAEQTAGPYAIPEKPTLSDLYADRPMSIPDRLKKEVVEAGSYSMMPEEEKYPVLEEEKYPVLEEEKCPVLEEDEEDPLAAFVPEVVVMATPAEKNTGVKTDRKADVISLKDQLVFALEARRKMNATDALNWFCSYLLHTDNHQYDADVLLDMCELLQERGAYTTAYAILSSPLTRYVQPEWKETLLKNLKKNETKYFV